MSEPRRSGTYPDYDYRKHRRSYGYQPDFTPAVPPKGWKLLPQGMEVPHRHMHFRIDQDGRWFWTEFRSINTMTAIFARNWGHVVAYAVPEECDLTQLKMYPGWAWFEQPANPRVVPY